MMPSYAFRPGPDEHSGYFGRYVALVPEGNILEVLRESIAETCSLVRSAAPSKADFAYAPGKWTVKEVIGHLSDVERVMVYRALRISRTDRIPLASFDEELYVLEGGFGDRTLDSLLEELRVIRQATVSFFAGLSEHAWTRRGTAANSPISVRALASIIAGHELHHRRVLRERYQL